MTVYVDPPLHPFRGMVMCHMWADSLEELLDMADKIGVSRKHIQGHEQLSVDKHKFVSWVHFDISKTKRDKAIKAGAVETDKYGPVEFRHVLELDHDDPEVRSRAREKLNQIRTRRKTNRPVEIQENLL